MDDTNQAGPREQHESLLDAIQGYDMWFVEERIRAEGLIAEDQIASAIRRFKNFMYLVARGSSDLNMPVGQIDIVWHTFLLFTSQYAEFCARYAGRFVHHTPTTSRSRGTASAGADDFFRIYEKCFGEDLHLIKGGSRETARSKCDTCRARVYDQNADSMQMLPS